MNLEEGLRESLRAAAERPLPPGFAASVMAKLPPRRTGRSWLALAPAAVVGLAVAVLLFAVSVPVTPPLSPTPFGSGGAATPTPSGSPAPTPIEHLTDAHAILLRLERTGGAILMEPSFQMPLFTLYGDGTALYRDEGKDLDLDPAVGPPFRVAVLDAAQVDDLLRFALGPGGLAAAGSRLDIPVSPVGITVFTLQAGGHSKTVWVAGLDLQVAIPSEDVAERAALAALAARLESFGDEVAAGRARDAGPYRPQAYRAVLDDAASLGVVEGEITAELGDWPWIDLRPTDFVGQPSQAGGRSATISSAEASTLLAVPQRAFGGVALRGPDGEAYVVRLRPLLPDELADPEPTADCGERSTADCGPAIAAARAALPADHPTVLRVRASRGRFCPSRILCPFAPPAGTRQVGGVVFTFAGDTPPAYVKVTESSEGLVPTMSGTLVWGVDP